MGKWLEEAAKHKGDVDEWFRSLSPEDRLACATELNEFLQGIFKTLDTLFQQLRVILDTTTKWYNETFEGLTISSRNSDGDQHA